jgi:hypothetical protein
MGPPFPAARAALSGALSCRIAILECVGCALGDYHRFRPDRLRWEGSSSATAAIAQRAPAHSKR